MVEKKCRADWFGCSVSLQLEIVRSPLCNPWHESGELLWGCIRDRSEIPTLLKWWAAMQQQRQRSLCFFFLLGFF